MAFQVKIRQTATAKDGTSFTLEDATGSYNVSTNPTGYGTPNPAITDVNTLQLVVYLPNATTPQDTYILTGTNAENVMNGTNDLVVTSLVLGETQSGDPLEELEAGLYAVTYTPFFDTGSTVSVTNGSATVSGTFNSYVIWGITSVLIGGERYEVDTVTNSTITLTTEYTGATNATATWYAGFQSIMVDADGVEMTGSYATNFAPLDSGLSSKVVDAYTSGCSCESKKVKTVNSYYDRYKTGVINLFNCGAYEQAQQLVNQITRWLNQEGNCGC